MRGNVQEIGMVQLFGNTMEQDQLRIVSQSIDGVDSIKLLYGDFEWVYFPRSTRSMPPEHIVWNRMDDDLRDEFLEIESNDADADTFLIHPESQLSCINASKATELLRNNFLEVSYPDQSKYGHVHYAMPSPVEFWPTLNTGGWEYAKNSVQGYIDLFDDLSKRENRLLQMEFWWEHLRRSDAFVNDCEKIRESHKSRRNFIINAFCGNHERLYSCTLSENEKIILQKWCIPIEYAFSFLHPEATSFRELLASLLMQTFFYSQKVGLSYEEGVKYFAMINEQLLLDIREKQQHIIGSQVKVEIVNQYGKDKKLQNPKLRFTIQVQNEEHLDKMISKINNRSIHYVKVKAEIENIISKNNMTRTVSFSISPSQKKYLNNRSCLESKMFFWYIEAYKKVVGLLQKEIGLVVPNYHLWRDKAGKNKDKFERTRISREMLHQYIAGLECVDPIKARPYFEKYKIGRSLNAAKAAAKRKGLGLISRIEEIAKKRRELLAGEVDSQGGEQNKNDAACQN